jgi:hypothetical protein
MLVPLASLNLIGYKQHGVSGFSVTKEIRKKKSHIFLLLWNNYFLLMSASNMFNPRSAVFDSDSAKLPF